MDTAIATILLSLMMGATSFQSSPVSGAADSYKVVCYLGSWANYRNGPGKFLIEDIDASLCTHLVYGFAKLEDSRIAVYDPYLDLKENWGLGAYDRFNSLKQKNPRLKTLIAIGGWNEGSLKYSQMAGSPSTRTTFVNSVLQFLLRYNFDGLDLDWEYPAKRGGSPDDKSNFILLLKELKKAFQPHGFILSAAVSAGSETIQAAYDVPSMAKYLDMINLMAYDFHGAWERVTGHNAPLYSQPEDSQTDQMLTVDSAVKIWLNLGAPREKIILGMPLYGRSFTLQDPSKTSVGSPTSGPGQAGPHTQEPGMIGFNEICKMMKTESGWTVVLNKYYKAPYMFKDRQWIGYDDIESIAVKVDYIKEMGLGGGMVWSLETDDFRGECEQFRYPLLTTIRRGLAGTPMPEINSTFVPPTRNVKTTKGTAFPKFTTPATTISGSTEAGSLCMKKGYFRDAQNCKRFYFCNPNQNGGYDIYWFTCAPGTVFSEALQSCNFPNFVTECQDNDNK